MYGATTIDNGLFTVGYSAVPLRPLSFAVHLARALKVTTPGPRLRQLLEMLTIPASAQLPIPTIEVPKSTVGIYKKLLLSSNQSDITFICDDGESIPAHKAILAAASPYFAAAFEGPWVENTSNREWKTSYPSSTIKALLTFVYTGDINESLVAERPFDMLTVASEFDITSLKELATMHCIESINVDNLKKTLQVAYLYSLDDLKMACIEFTSNNWATALTNTSVVSLAQDDPNLWADFTASLTSETSNEN